MARISSAYTKVFETGTTIKGVKLNHACGTTTSSATPTARSRSSGRAASTRHRDGRSGQARFYARSTAARGSHLPREGWPEAVPDEQDYTGLSALDPDDPHTIYVSTFYDPNDDTTKSTKREIWRGTTCDNGATFKWTPVTARSTVDNIRPIVPKWDSSHTALLWLNGTYTTAQNYAMKVVGLVGPKN